MADNIKIKVYRSDDEKAKLVVTVPLAVLRIARRLLPEKIRLDLEKDGIDLDEIVNLAEKQQVTGTLVEVEHEEGTERIVISIE